MDDTLVTDGDRSFQMRAKDHYMTIKDHQHDDGPLWLAYSDSVLLSL